MEKSDNKHRYAGFLENPWISMFQRAIMDGGRCRGMRRALKGFAIGNVVDIGCGLGEMSTVVDASYTGVDNSEPRIKFARKKYPSRTFFVSDGRNLELEEKSFDTGFLIDTSHHLSDQDFKDVLTSMVRICRDFIIVSDPIFFEGQSRLSKKVYYLDRGGCYRSVVQMEKIFSSIDAVRLREVRYFKTFPGLYKHAVCVLDLEKK